MPGNPVTPGAATLRAPDLHLDEKEGLEHHHKNTGTDRDCARKLISAVKTLACVEGPVEILLFRNVTKGWFFEILSSWCFENGSYVTVVQLCDRIRMQTTDIYLERDEKHYLKNTSTANTDCIGNTAYKIFWRSIAWLNWDYSFREVSKSCFYFHVRSKESVVIAKTFSVQKNYPYWPCMNSFWLV